MYLLPLFFLFQPGQLVTSGPMKKPENTDLDELVATQPVQPVSSTPDQTQKRWNRGIKQSQFKILYLIVLFCLVLPALCDNLSKFKTCPNQTLPRTCWNYFRLSQECPEIDYEEINTKCCGTQTDLFLHCQVFNSHLHICCLPKTLVEKGTYMAIVETDGRLEKVTHPCDKDHYEPKDRWSNSLIYQYCTHPKYKCSKEIGQQLLCRGGPSKDDQCQCMPDFRSNCNRGYNDADDHECLCYESKCPNGTERCITYQYSVQQCPNQDIALNNSCLPVCNQTPEISFTHKTSLTTQTPIQFTSNSTDDAAGTDTNGSSKQNFLAFLVIIPVAVFFIAVNRRFREAVVKRFREAVQRVRTVSTPSHKQVSGTEMTCTYTAVPGNPSV